MSGEGAADRTFREDPAEWTVRLGRSLRSRGVACSVADTVDAVRALEHLDADDPLDVYFGLRAVLLSDPARADTFERCFWSLWSGRGEVDPAEGDAGPDADTAGAPEPEERATEGADATARRTVLDRLRAARADEAETGDGDPTGAAYSPRESVGRRSFGSLHPSEVREVDRVLDRLMLRLATRRSRRLRRARRRGRVDLRRSFREAVRHHGEMLRLARRRRRIERPRVVLLCDVSGSMERYSRFLVRFLLSAGRERDVETFVFSTRLTRLTPLLGPRSVDEVLARIGRSVRDWSGGTRIGACLEEFLERHGRTLLGRRTVVVILSDGLDRGDVDALERAMAGIHRKARKVVWLNPLLESDAYRPEARGMKAALPHVDEFAPGHNLEALQDLAAMIRL